VRAGVNTHSTENVEDAETKYQSRLMPAATILRSIRCEPDHSFAASAAPNASSIILEKGKMEPTDAGCHDSSQEGD